MKMIFTAAVIITAINVQAQNVGIGTNNPQKKLHVFQGTSGGSFHPNATAVFESNTTNLLQLSNSSTSIGGIFSGTNITQQRSAIKFEADSSIIFTSGGTLNRMMLDNNGYLGINNFAPTSRLHVSNGTSGNTAISSSRVATFEDNSSAYLQLLTPNANETGILAGNASTLIKSGIVFTADSAVQIRTGGNNTRVRVDNDGAVIFNAPSALPSSGTVPPVTGNGNRFVWWPDKAALRIGGVVNQPWPENSIGKWSFSGGFNTAALGDYSMSVGNSTDAFGDGAFATGNGSSATANYSFAGGYNSEASGSSSIAFGSNARTGAGSSISVGAETMTGGSYSAAFGYKDTASGFAAGVFGSTNNASGDFSYAFGYGLLAKPFGTFVVGSYNIINTNSPTVPSLYAPVFVVGTGTDNNNRENGVEIYRDGQIVMNYLKVKTTVTSNLTPHTDDTYKLGSSSKRWQEVWSANPFLQSSDVRLKTNIKPLQYGLKTVIAMKPVSYHMKNNLQQTELGFLAQDMEKIVPEVVVSPENDGLKAMKYSSLIPVLVQALKDQQQIIERLEKRIAVLEKK